MSSSKFQLLRCEVTKGMFKGECAVTATTSEGTKVSWFSPEDRVRKSGTGRFMVVEVLKSNSKQGVVRLPTTSIEGPSVICVESGRLAPLK